MIKKNIEILNEKVEGVRIELLSKFPDNEKYKKKPHSLTFSNEIIKSSHTKKVLSLSTSYLAAKTSMKYVIYQNNNSNIDKLEQNSLISSTISTDSKNINKSDLHENLPNTELGSNSIVTDSTNKSLGRTELTIWSFEEDNRNFLYDPLSLLTVILAIASCHVIPTLPITNIYLNTEGFKGLIMVLNNGFSLIMDNENSNNNDFESTEYGLKSILYPFPIMYLLLSITEEYLYQNSRCRSIFETHNQLQKQMGKTMTSLFFESKKKNNIYRPLMYRLSSLICRVLTNAIGINCNIHLTIPSETNNENKYEINTLKTGNFSLFDPPNITTNQKSWLKEFILYLLFIFNLWIKKSDGIYNYIAKCVLQIIVEADKKKTLVSPTNDDNNRNDSENAIPKTNENSSDSSIYSVSENTKDIDIISYFGKKVSPIIADTDDIDEEEIDLTTISKKVLEYETIIPSVSNMCTSTCAFILTSLFRNPELISTIFGYSVSAVFSGKMNNNELFETSAREPSQAFSDFNIDNKINNQNLYKIEEKNNSDSSKLNPTETSQNSQFLKEFRNAGGIPPMTIGTEYLYTQNSMSLDEKKIIERIDNLLISLIRQTMRVNKFNEFPFLVQINNLQLADNEKLEIMLLQRLQKLLSSMQNILSLTTSTLLAVIITISGIKNGPKETILIQRLECLIVGGYTAQQLLARRGSTSVSNQEYDVADTVSSRLIMMYRILTTDVVMFISYHQASQPLPSKMRETIRTVYTYIKSKLMMEIEKKKRTDLQNNTSKNNNNLQKKTNEEINEEENQSDIASISN